MNIFFRETQMEYKDSRDENELEIEANRITRRVSGRSQGLCKFLRSKDIIARTLQKKSIFIIKLYGSNFPLH